VEYFLYVAAVEVVIWSATERRKSELVIEIGTIFHEMINVETWIHQVSRIVYIIVKIASWE